jgi:hypothetical protein
MSGKKRVVPYVKVPLWWLEHVTKASRSPRLMFLVWLLRLSWEARSNTFPVPNGRLKARGVDRRVKRRALADLETAGVITVLRRHGKTPLVTLVVV